ncbi:hypothetical protein JRQ81_012331 [Phrynocephalus forsythii]|uniref:Uncharacterized protein n=1 Tax=Phrynocephalus forsythii TaxID=171643 RepID=A0A9Q1AQ15_9SAUR|nr:hypothetical protein JRQ81_012331 [Phrynocephalus forsythii]
MEQKKTSPEAGRKSTASGREEKPKKIPILEGVSKPKPSTKSPSTKSIKPAKSPKPESFKASVSPQILTVEMEFSGSAAPMTDQPEFQQLLPTDSSDSSSDYDMALPPNISLIKPGEKKDKKSHHKQVQLPPTAPVQVSDLSIRFKLSNIPSVPSLSVTTAEAEALAPLDPSSALSVPSKPPKKRCRTGHHQSPVPSVSVPPIPAFSLKFNGRQWSIQSSDSTEIEKHAVDSSSNSSVDSMPSDFESEASDSVHLVTSPDSEVEEKSPQPSLEAMRNYTGFLVRMAKTIDLPIHQTKPKRVCHTAPRPSPLGPSRLDCQLYSKGGAYDRAQPTEQIATPQLFA